MTTYDVDWSRRDPSALKLLTASECWVLQTFPLCNQETLEVVCPYLDFAPLILDVVKFITKKDVTVLVADTETVLTYVKDFYPSPVFPKLNGTILRQNCIFEPVKDDPIMGLLIGLVQEALLGDFDAVQLKKPWSITLCKENGVIHNVEAHANDGDWLFAEAQMAFLHAINRPPGFSESMDLSVVLWGDWVLPVKVRITAELIYIELFRQACVKV